MLIHPPSPMARSTRKAAHRRIFNSDFRNAVGNSETQFFTCESRVNLKRENRRMKRIFAVHFDASIYTRTIYVQQVHAL